jgi:serine/threonine protein kinase
MTTNSNNKIHKDNKWDRWIENGIDSEYIDYHDYNEFQNIERIGTGGFGVVYRANWKSSNTIVTLKSLKSCYMKEIANEVYKFDDYLILFSNSYILITIKLFS